MPSMKLPYEFLIYGWTIGIAFHATLHFVVKVWTGWRLFRFWSGPRP
jgi:hypothetical protein